jgi:hypothetical protein
MSFRPLSRAIAMAAVMVATITLSSCAWLSGWFGKSIARAWEGTLIDLYEPATYHVTLDLEQDGDVVTGTGTFTFDEEFAGAVTVDGSREEDGTFIVTMYDVDGADVTLTGDISDGGSTFSGTWDLDAYENFGTFELTPSD